jgi:two-component system, chemotaxis family, chemotaxis protein CheY
MASRILIVDDNALVRRALGHALEKTGGWEIFEAENGELAINKARETNPNLIILDLAMPVMDGMRAARALCIMLPGVPIIMHTLHWSPRVEIEALKAGVRRVVAKSDSATILAAVRELLAPEPIGYIVTVEEPLAPTGDVTVIRPARAPAQGSAVKKLAKTADGVSGPADR